MPVIIKRGLKTPFNNVLHDYYFLKNAFNCFAKQVANSKKKCKADFGADAAEGVITKHIYYLWSLNKKVFCSL